ncbi:hypothetical protein D3C81_1805720 [compost metagenome]
MLDRRFSFQNNKFVERTLNRHFHNELTTCLRLVLNCVEVLATCVVLSADEDCVVQCLCNGLQNLFLKFRISIFWRVDINVRQVSVCNVLAAP